MEKKLKHESIDYKAQLEECKQMTPEQIFELASKPDNITREDYIKKKFRLLSLKYHPDIIRDNEEDKKTAEEIFKTIEDAYSKLTGKYVASYSSRNNYEANHEGKENNHNYFTVIYDSEREGFVGVLVENGIMTSKTEEAFFNPYSAANNISSQRREKHFLIKIPKEYEFVTIENVTFLKDERITMMLSNDDSGFDTCYVYTMSEEGKEWLHINYETIIFLEEIGILDKEDGTEVEGWEEFHYIVTKDFRNHKQDI